MTFHVATSGPVPDIVDSLLRSLPEWFGIDSSILEYVAASKRLPTILASDDAREPVGILLHERHFPTSAEIHLMAMRRGWHRRGVGAALVAAAQRLAEADGVKILSVKTLGPSHPDLGYADTRTFYLASGFQPVEELHGLWGDTPCLLMVKPL